MHLSRGEVLAAAIAFGVILMCWLGWKLDQFFDRYEARQRLKNTD